ncbi:hypothetical protein L0156_10395 [bacterium]|nr:hypothetical protein [bacterium]
MRFYYTTGSTFEKDELPQRLGVFKTFRAAESAARQLLISEPSGVIYLYLPASNCGTSPPPMEFVGWRARYCLVRIVTSLAPRRKGTPLLLGSFGVFDEVRDEAVDRFRINLTDSSSAVKEESVLVDRDSLADSRDAEPSLSLAQV